MNAEVRHALVRLLLLALPLGALGAPATVGGATDSREYRFDVFLDDRRIGEHHFEVVGEPGAERVRSQANFEFKLLFVTLYRYRHLANEEWREGCLTDLTSATNDNGKTFEIEAAVRQTQLRLTRLKPEPRTEEIEAACPVTFAYWDLQRMSADAMINAQTGELSATRLIREDSEHLDDVEAVRYRLEVEGLSPIRLWYRSDDDAWLRLATLRDGRLLEYRRDVEGLL